VFELSTGRLPQIDIHRQFAHNWPDIASEGFVAQPKMHRATSGDRRGRQEFMTDCLSAEESRVLVCLSPTIQTWPSTGTPRSSTDRVALASSAASSIEGLTDEEYFWQPVPGCWTISRRGTSAAQVSLGAGDFTWDFARSGDGEILFTSVEIIHHGAEVCLLRDLYRKDHW
jgi:hypothetical protein